jgi:hypothetical protein
MVVARSASEEELVVGGKESWFPMNVVDGIEAMMRERTRKGKGQAKGRKNRGTRKGGIGRYYKW